MADQDEPEVVEVDDEVKRALAEWAATVDVEELTDRVVAGATRAAALGMVFAAARRDADVGQLEQLRELAARLRLPADEAPLADIVRGVWDVMGGPDRWMPSVGYLEAIERLCGPLS